MNALSLKSGGGVGQIAFAVQLVKIFSTELQRIDHRAMVSPGERLHGKKFTPPPQNMQFDYARLWSP
jgi:hypothetical protein